MVFWEIYNVFKGLIAKLLGGRYSREARTKLLVRSICVSRQLSVSNYSIWTGDVLHTFIVLKLYMWFIISFSFAIHSPIS